MDIDLFLKIGLGYLGLASGQFWEMRLKDFFLMLQQKNETEEANQRLKCNLIRTQTSILFNIQIKKEDRLPPEELWPFPWDLDKKEKEPEMSLTEGEIIERSNKLFDMLPKIK